MIIFGRSVCFVGSVAEGWFQCLNCGADRHYKLKVGRRWCTLFRHPVLPLNKVAEVVQCSTCDARYHPGVLSVPTAGQLSVAYPGAVTAAVSLVLRAGAAASPLARARAVDAIRFAGGDGYSQATLSAALAQPVPALQQRLAAASGALAPVAREGVLAEATQVALADGPLTADERGVLAAAGGALELTAARVDGVIIMIEQAHRMTTGPPAGR